MTSPDSVLRELVDARDQEVAARARARREAELDVETRAESSSDRARKLLGNLNEVVQKLDEDYAEHAGKDAHRLVTEAKTRLMAGPAERDLLQAPDRAPAVAAASLYAVLQPYFVKLYKSDGTVYYQGYSPGIVDLWDDARGSGNGWFGSGAQTIDVLADWWFYFSANTNRSYGYTITCPMHGFYICYADDGFWDSKEAHVRVDLSAMGYQYNAKPTTTVNLFDYDGQNINLANRYDNAPVFYYSDLLGADTAYLRVTQSLYAYARGGGSHAELNFADGAANYLAPPVVYVT